MTIALMVTWVSACLRWNAALGTVAYGDTSVNTGGTTKVAPLVVTDTGCTDPPTSAAMLARLMPMFAVLALSTENVTEKSWPLEDERSTVLPPRRLWVDSHEPVRSLQKALTENAFSPLKTSHAPVESHPLKVAETALSTVLS